VGVLLSLLAPPLCWACGRVSRAAEALCLGCRAGLRWLPPDPIGLAGLPAWAPLAYEGPARALVSGLKFRAARGLGVAMAAPIVARAPPSLLDGAVLVPVPIDPHRLRRRGFNQAAVLAAAIAARTGLPALDALARIPGRAPQTGRRRKDRLAGMRGRFTLRTGAGAPRRALLVDDVITTGATLAACAAALREAGSERVAALAYARTLGR
jgi:ComF family protein